MYMILYQIRFVGSRELYILKETLLIGTDLKVLTVQNAININQPDCKLNMFMSRISRISPVTSFHPPPLCSCLLIAIEIAGDAILGTLYKVIVTETWSVRVAPVT